MRATWAWLKLCWTRRAKLLVILRIVTIIAITQLVCCQIPILPGYSVPIPKKSPGIFQVATYHHHPRTPSHYRVASFHPSPSSTHTKPQLPPAFHLVFTRTLPPRSGRRQLAQISSHPSRVSPLPHRCCQVILDEQTISSRFSHHILCFQYLKALIPPVLPNFDAIGSSFAEEEKIASLCTATFDILPKLTR